MIILLSFIASVDHCCALILENTLIRCNEFAFACHQASGIHVGFTNFSVGGYITGSEAPRIIREAILRLCAELKDEAVSLVDVLAPTDFILNSPIGASDGEVSLVWIPVYFCSFWGVWIVMSVISCSFAVALHLLLADWPVHCLLPLPCVNSSLPQHVLDLGALLAGLWKFVSDVAYHYVCFFLCE